MRYTQQNNSKKKRKKRVKLNILMGVQTVYKEATQTHEIISKGSF